MGVGARLVRELRLMSVDPIRSEHAVHECTGYVVKVDGIHNSLCARTLVQEPIDSELDAYSHEVDERRTVLDSNGALSPSHPDGWTGGNWGHICLLSFASDKPEMPLNHKVPWQEG